MPNYIHHLDKGSACAIHGEKAEVMFKNILISDGYEVKEATRADQLSHVDLIATKNKQITRFDIKARKKISRSDSDYNNEFLWIEILNGYKSNNNPNGLGWLFGASDFIVFEGEKDFMVVDREKLVSFVKENCNLKKFVTQSKNALYSNYKRFGRSDSLTLIKVSDAQKLAKKIYTKA